MVVSVVTVEVLPAGRGDCLWVECRRRGRPWRLLIDGGMPEAWPVLRDRILALPSGERIVDLAVMTHIDADHIGGMLPLFAANDLGISFGDVWFNGLIQLPDKTGQSRSVAQAERLTASLRSGSGAPMPWNAAFRGAAVMTKPDGTHLTIRGRRSCPTITVLSPSPTRLARLRRVWEAELDRAQRGEPSEPELPEQPLRPLNDLEGLAATTTTMDTSIPNGSSIALLVEHRDVRCLFAGDAHVPSLGVSLTSLANERGGQPIPIDVFKLSHHGSTGNVTPALLALVPARRYVVSTNGDRFHHPDDIALARVVTSGPSGLTLCFNYETDATRRWDDESLKARYGFRTEFPTAGSSGLRIDVEGP